MVEGKGGHLCYLSEDLELRWGGEIVAKSVDVRVQSLSFQLAVQRESRKEGDSITQ